jgi:hypothetical protein
MNTPNAPLLLNLTGAYVVPSADTSKQPIAGSVSGDLRLAALDAFLHTLSGYSKDAVESELFAASLRQIVQAAASVDLGKRDIVLSIDYSIAKDTRMLTHTFKFSTPLKAVC